MRHRPFTAAAMFLAMLALLACPWRRAAAQVIGEIVGPGATSYPIAVSVLQDLNTTGADDGAVRFADILSRDLDLSGYFRVIDRKAYIDDPQTSPTTADQIEFQNWTVLGALALVKGTIDRVPRGIVIEVRLFDVSGRRELAAKRYRAPAGELPRVAHRFADEVLRVLTGSLGPFDSRIAFISTRAGGQKDLYTMTFDSAPVRLTADRSIVVSPAWSPRVDRILFTSYRRKNPGLYILDLGKQRSSLIARATSLSAGGEWSPDGSQIAATVAIGGNPEVVLLRPDGSMVRRLTRHAGIDVSPSWSPDGKEIAFCSDRAGGPQIFAIEVASGRVRRITYGGSYNTSPAWSPVRDEIAYTGRVSGRFQLFVVDSRGGRGRQLTKTAGDHEDPSWSPDGRYLAHSSTVGGSSHLFMMDRLGRVRKQLTHGEGDDSSPAWSPRLQ